MNIIDVVPMVQHGQAGKLSNVPKINDMYVVLHVHVLTSTVIIFQIRLCFSTRRSNTKCNRMFSTISRVRFTGYPTTNSGGYTGSLSQKTSKRHR